MEVFSLRKFSILISLILILSFSATAYNTTVDVSTTANITIRYYGNTSDSKINITVHGAERIYSLLENRTDTISFSIPYTYSCERSQKCEDYLDYINESLSFATLYADEKAKRTQAEEATKNQNERRKEAEAKLPPLQANVDSYRDSFERYKSDWKICNKDFEYCNATLTTSIKKIEEVESANWSWGGIGAVIGALGVWFWMFYKKKPRSPDKDIKEVPPAEEPE